MTRPTNICARLLVVVTLLVTLGATLAARPALAATPTTPLYLLTDDNRLVAVTEALPGQPATPVAVTGLAAGDTLVAIAVRPQNGRLYGLGSNSAAGTVQLYHLSPLASGATPIVATAIGLTAGTLTAADGVTVVPVQGPRFGIDFNPTVDRLRVVTSSGLNFRINPNNGAFVDSNALVTGINPDGGINGGPTGVDATSYTNSAPNVTVTTQYTLDSATDKLYIQNPPNAGTQTTPLALTLNGTALDFTAVGGFDIPPGVNVAAANAPATGAAFATLTVGGVTGLYQIELSTGAVTSLGSYGALAVRGMAVFLPTPSGLTLSADGSSLQRFTLAAPGTVVPVAITGVTAGETLVGVDGRPATGQLFGLGINATADNGTLYLIDPQGTAGTTTATVIGTTGSIAFVDGAGAAVDLPDPTAGYGVDFNPTVDRVRVVTGSGLNFRLNPITGAAVDGDNGGAAGSVAGTNTDGLVTGLPAGSTGVDATAYTNAYGGASTTTQYTLDATSNRLFIQNPPNVGTQTRPLTVTLNAVPLDFTAANGFDIPPGASVSASNTPANGNGYAALTVGGTTSLYQINLATGAATALGALGTGATGVAGLVVWAEALAAQLTAATTTVSEAAGTVNLTVTTSGGAPLIVSYTTGGGTATAGSDYTATSGTLVLGGNVITQTIALPIINDTAVEANETVEVRLNGAGISQIVTVTIQDNDLPTVQFSAATYIGGEVRGTATLTVTLSQAATAATTVSYATANGTATAGSDYTATTGTLTFAPGETSKTIVVPVLADQVKDAGETFTVTLSGAAGLTLGTPASAQVTIADDKPDLRLFLPLALK